MTTERIDIAVRQRGAKKVARDIKGIGGAASAANKGIQLLTAGIAGIAAVGVARQVIGLANSYQQLSNKVRVAVGEQGDLNGTLDALFQIADRTRGPVDALVTLYQRSSLAANELGASQQQLLEFTETVGTALALQGGAASEASGALLQLSQSLGSGVVRADEFNSILEGAFPIAREAAAGIDEAGGSVAKLRQLVIEGKVSSDVFFNAILSQSADLKRQFEQTAPTVDQALTRIKNAFTEAAGSGNLDPLVDSLNDFADLVADPGFQEGFGKFVSGVVTVASVAAQGAVQFANLGDALAQSFASISGNLGLEDELRAELDGVEAALDGNFFTTPIKFLGTDDAELERLKEDLQGQLDQLSFEITGIRPTPGVNENDGGGAGGNTSITGGGIDPKLLEQQNKFLDGLKTQNAELEIQASLGDSAAAALARYKTEQEIIALQLSPAQADSARAVTEQIIEQNAAIQAQEDLASQQSFIESLEQQEQRLRIQAEAGEDAAAALVLYNAQLEATALGAGPDFVELALDIAEGINEQTAALEAAQRAQQDLDVLSDLEAEAELIGLTNRERAIETELRRLSADATDAQIAKTRELAGAIFDENESLRRAAITFDEFIKETARSAQQTLSGALADPLGDGFEDLPRKFANVLQQLAADFFASQIFKGLSNIGGGGGGIAGAIGDFFAGGFATGGSFKVPGSGGVDSQLVSMKATPGERVTITRPQDEARLGAAQAAPEVNVTPNIINVFDQDQALSALSSDQGQQAILNVVRQNRDQVQAALR